MMDPTPLINNLHLIRWMTDKMLTIEECYIPRRVEYQQLKDFQRELEKCQASRNC